MSQSNTPVSWECVRPPRRGACAKCGIPGHNITITAQATSRAQGRTTSLSAASVALCNDHALELFGKLSAAVDGYRAL